LLAQIDAANLVPYLSGKVLPPSQQTAILREPERERRTAMLLDWLETKPTSAYHAFVEAVGELYPHIYLELTGSGRDDGIQSVNINGLMTSEKVSPVGDTTTSPPMAVNRLQTDSKHEKSSSVLFGD